MSNTIYCTYLTVYSGDKLPPLYIGSTSTQKIEAGYHGSVSSKKYKQIWKSELKENPHLFQTQILTTHNTREEALEEEMRLQELHDVIRSPLYINMAVANGKLMFNDYDDPEYRKKISESNKGKKRSEEIKKRLSESGKKRFENPDERKKMSEYHKGKHISEETKKKMSISQKGRKHTEESKKLISEATQGNRNPMYGRKRSDTKLFQPLAAKAAKISNRCPVMCEGKYYDSVGEAEKHYIGIKLRSRLDNPKYPNFYRLKAKTKRK